MADLSEVFIVFGRNTRALDAVKLFLRALDLRPLTFDEVRDSIGGSPFVGDVIRTGMDKAQAILILLTPDEFASLRPSLRNPADILDEQERWQARANVLLEAGMALAIDQRRTILVTLGRSTLPSDLSGRAFIRLTNGPEARTRLRNALETVGCRLGRVTSDWLNPALSGDFETATTALPEVGAAVTFRTR